MTSNRVIQIASEMISFINTNSNFIEKSWAGDAEWQHEPLSKMDKFLDRAYLALHDFHANPLKIIFHCEDVNIMILVKTIIPIILNSTKLQQCSAP